MSLSTRKSIGRAEKQARRRRQPAARQKAALVAHHADDGEKRDRVEVEDGLGLGVVAALHAVAGEAENVADAERRGAEHRALDGDAVRVAAGDLQDGRIADPRQDRGDGDARHVAMGARAVGRIDAVDPAFERFRRRAHLLGVGRIGRAQFRRDGEFPTAQDALEPPTRRMARQIDQRRGRIGPEVVRMGRGAHARAVSRATRSQVDEPFRV
jgi:hypothetical protein